ncbi:MAG: DUF6603 domain-containing protein [Gemmatimonadales bacterium]
MAVSLPEDALDPLVRKIGEVAGLLSTGGSPSVRDEFLAHPLDELANALKDRQNEVIELLSQIVGDSNAEILGMPGAGTDDHWLPIRDPDGNPTGLYVVMTRKEPSLIVGLGWKWETTEDRVTIRTWAHVPLLATAGTTATTRIAVGTEDAPVRVAAEVVLEDGFGVEGLRFRGVRGAVAVKGTTNPPDIALVLLGLQVGDSAPEDRSLTDLGSLPANTWIETAMALFTAQLAQAGDGTTANIVNDYVLPLLGVSGEAPMVRLAWEKLPEKGRAVFDEWFSSMVSSPDTMRAWLAKWQGLLQIGAGISPTASVAGSGTRADPWVAEVGVAGGVVLSPTAALETRADGVRMLYLGLRVGSTPFAIGTTALRLDLTASSEIVAIPVGSPASVQSLPSLSVLLRLTSTAGTLVAHTFPGGDPLAALGTLSVGSLEAGLRLDAQQQPVPHIAMRDVQCARGTWTVIDLSSADALLDGLGSVVSNLIQQQIEQGLSLATPGPHAGRHIAALLGFVAPSAAGTPSPWPVALTTDATRITQFLGNPMSAIARYHAACLTTDIDGTPAWKYILAEVGDLLGEPRPGDFEVAGSGDAGNPWRLTLASAGFADLLLRAHFEIEGTRPRLHVMVALEPPSLPIDDVALALSFAVDLFSVELPEPSSSETSVVAWLPGLRAGLTLARFSGLETPRLGGLRLGADSMSLSLDRSPDDGLDCVLQVQNPWAAWDGVAGGTLLLPALTINRDGVPSWNLAAPDLDGALGAVERDAIAELSRFLVGHLALEHGGPIGFGLSALLGLLPGDPQLSMPSWREGDPGFALPADFPVLQPADWGLFFADPWPTLRAHLLRVLAEPRYTQPVLQWLRAALRGLAPKRGGGPELLTFPEALGDAVLFTPPDGRPSEREPEDVPLGFPTLETLPVTVGGDGTYASPYALGLRAPAARGVDALLWLDPDGPPAGTAIDAAIAALAPALRDLSRLDGVGIDGLLDVLSALSNVDQELASALEGITPASLSTSLTQLETFLGTSDGVVLTASQQPPDASWTSPAVLEAGHTHQLEAAEVVSTIKNQITSWDAGAGLPVLLLSAPFERNAAWSTLATALGTTAAPFSYRVSGSSPNAVSLLTLAGISRITAAELAVYDETPGLSATQRLVPMEGAAGTSSQAEQVVRLVERVRMLQPGKQVIIVAHSSSGLAARAAVQRAGLSAAVRGVITIGTPHVGSPLPWASDQSAREAVGALHRMTESLPFDATVKPALDALWRFIRGRDLSDNPQQWPAHAFTPSGPIALPGVEGLAIATRLPPLQLRGALARAISTRATQLRAAFDARAPVTTIGVGLRLASVTNATDATVDVQVRVRVDIAQIRIAPPDSTRPAPRLVIEAVLKRRDGWLAGSPGSRVRVRWAELACDMTADEIVPRVVLHDVEVDGVEQATASIRRFAEGGWQPDDVLVPALDAVLAELTSAPGPSANVVALARLLSSLEVTKLRGSSEDDGYAINPDGWSAVLADGRAAMRRILAAVASDTSRRTGLIAQLRDVLGTSASDFSRLLSDAAADPPEWRALRALLRAVGLLDSVERGSTPVLSEWMALLQSPAEYARTRVATLLRDETRATQLLAELRAIVGVSDIGSPVIELPLGTGVRIRVEASGKVSLRIASESPLSLGAALSMTGVCELDLVNGKGEVTLRLQPAEIITAVRWRMVMPVGTDPLSWDFAVDFSDGVLGNPFDALPLYPVPVDLPARLSALLPRVTLSAIATALLDSLVVPRLPELAGPLVLLGLAEKLSAGRPRFRNVSRLIADPLGWLLSPNSLGVSGPERQLDASRVASLVREVASAFHLADGDGNIELPYGLQVNLPINPTPQIEFAMPVPRTLGAGLTLAVDCSFGWTSGGAIGAAGSLDLRAVMPPGGGWPVLRVLIGTENGSLRVALGADDAMLQLVPFSGFSADALGAAANRLLPTLLDALLDALAASGHADVASFVTRVRAAATTLEVDTIARLDLLVDDPVVWIRQRFSAANAPASAGALRDVLTGVPGFTVAGGKLQFQPGGSPVAVTIGRNGSIGAGIVMSDLDLGPVTLSSSFSVGISDSGPVAPIVHAVLDASVDDGIITPGGVSIRPSVHLGIGSSGLTLHAYPIGNVAGSPDFRLDILPAFAFGVDDGGATESVLRTLARRVLAPLVIETFLDTSDVTAWLNAELRPGLRPGEVLRDAGLLLNAGTSWNLAPLDTLADPMRLVEGLIGASLRSTFFGFGTNPIVDFSAEAGPGAGIFAASAADESGTAYGLRVSLPELRLSDDPEVIVRLGARTDWIAGAGGPPGVGPGLSLLVIRDNGAGGNPRFTFDPTLELGAVGISVSGRVDEPLVDVEGFRLGGIEALLYLRVSRLLTEPEVKFGLYGDLSKIAVPLGASDSNPVAASLMSGRGDNGDDEAVNPEFSIRAGYVENLWVEIGGERRNEVWFPIQRTFGPVSVQQIGVRWIGGPASKLAVLLDGGVALAGLAVGVDDLSLTMPLARITRIDEWELGLRGLAVSYNAGGVKIAGGLLQASDEIRYDGFLLIEVGGRSFVAFGSYGVVDGDTSLFVFLVVGIPIGGPPYFFIIGLAGGFGYNRGLTVPAIEGVPAFPLVSAMSDPGVVTADPMEFLRGLGPSFPMERGSYWFTAGIKFTSFTLVKSQALLYVLLNRGLEVGILGMSQMELPPGAPLVSIELALKARFSTNEGLVSVEGRLTDNSWLLSRSCRLTGGFAFLLWFDGEHAGDFVISIGGYHPRYTRPAHYPDVPRLGFNWRVGSAVTIKGEAYFALTPREVMAGGLLEAVYKSGDVKAWFSARANMYVQWRPFWFDVEIGVTVGIEVDTWLGTVRTETSADLWLWGPDVGGRVRVSLWVVSFTVRFGAAYNRPSQTLSWADFRTMLLPPENDKLYSGNVERGLIAGSPASGPWTVLPEFVLRTDIFLGTARVKFGMAAETDGGALVQIDIKPMKTPVNIASVHKVRVIRLRDGQDVTDRFQQREVLRGNVARALWDTDDSNPSQSVMSAITGARLVAEFDVLRLDSTGSIPWTKLFETGRRHPLPFTPELEDRAIVSAAASRAGGLDAFALRASDALGAANVILGDRAWTSRKAVTLKALEAEGVRITPSQRNADVTPRGTFRRGRRSSPPLVRSLYEGLAAEPIVAANREEREPVLPPARPIVPMHVTLDAIIRQRAEPTRASLGALRTTVSPSQFSRTVKIADMRALRDSPIAGAAVLTAPVAQGSRESGIARSMKTLRRGLGSTAEDVAILDTLEKAAWRSPSDELHAVRMLASTGRTSAPVDPGSILRFTLPTRDVDELPPELLVGGDAAVRVTALDRGGNMLMDTESVGEVRIAIPSGSATVAVTGLGRSTRKEIRRGPGAVTMHEATAPVAVVGWQSHSELIVAGQTTLLARGALVMLASRIARLDDVATVTAGTAIADQLGVTTVLPAAVRSIAIVLDEADDACIAALDETLAVSAQGAVLSDAPRIVAAGARTVLLYDVIAVDRGIETISVPVAASTAWTLCGVMGFSEPASDWAVLLATADLDALVENGPLTPTGAAAVRFVPRDSNPARDPAPE